MIDVEQAVLNDLSAYPAGCAEHCEAAGETFG
jgi:hypothetical protein